jgi:hypothetical protein
MGYYQYKIKKEAINYDVDHRNNYANEIELDKAKRRNW